MDVEIFDLQQILFQRWIKLKELLPSIAFNNNFHQAQSGNIPALVTTLIERLSILTHAHSAHSKRHFSHQKASNIIHLLRAKHLPWTRGRQPACRVSPSRISINRRHSSKLSPRLWSAVKPVGALKFPNVNFEVLASLWVSRYHYRVPGPAHPNDCLSNLLEACVRVRVSLLNLRSCPRSAPRTIPGLWRRLKES